MKKIDETLVNLGVNKNEFYYIADSALFSETNLNLAAEKSIKLITRMPDNVLLAQNAIHEIVNKLPNLDCINEYKAKYLLPVVNFHGLRHTNATLLISQGVDVTTVSKRLGHSKTSTTTDIYSHSLKKTDMLAADKLDNLFSKKSSNIEKQG